MKRHWKEPVNGVTVFFSEESYTRVLGTVSLQERLATKFDEDKYGVQSFRSLAPFQGKSDPTQGKTEPLTQDKPGPVSQVQTAPPESGRTDAQKEIKATQGQRTEEATGKKKGVHPLGPKARKSSLNSKEQRRYLELFQKYLMSYRPQQPSQAEIKELTEFEGLQLRVSTEQAAFLQYTEQVTKSRRFDYNQMLPAARKYVNEKLTHQWRRVDQYARYYIPDKTIPLVVTTDQDYCPALVHDKLLLELGSFPKVFMPDMTRQNEVPSQYDKINKRFPSNGRKTTNNKAWNHEVCSRDVNAELLAQRHGCQIVTCTSALQCLVDNHTPAFDREWEIPVVIKQYEHDYGDISAKQKVVFIDKPFAPKAMNNRQTSTLYHKYALKTFITQPSYPRGHRQAHAATEVKEVKHSKPDSTNPFDDDVNMEDLETFGSLDFGKSDKKLTEKSFEKTRSDKVESIGLLPKGMFSTVSKKEKSDDKAEPKPTSENSGHGASAGGTKTSTEKETCIKGSVIESQTTAIEHTDTPDKEMIPKTSETEKSAKERSSQKEGSVADRAKSQLFSSSGGDTSQDEGLVIDVPDPSPPQRTTRSRSKKQTDPVHEVSTPKVPSRRSSPRLSRQAPKKSVAEEKTEECSVVGVTENSDSDNDLVIDLGDTASPDRSKRKTKSQAAEEFPVPKRVLRKRKSTETCLSVESDSDVSPERRRTRARSASGQRSRSNSETKMTDETETKTENETKSISISHGTESVTEDIERHTDTGSSAVVPVVSDVISPSKVDNIMIKTSTDDLSLLPPTSEAKVLSPQNPGVKSRRLGGKTGLSPLDSILQLQEQMLPTGKARSDQTGQGAQGDLSEFHHPEEHNVSYHMWTFSGLTLLTRSSCHGVLRDLAHKAQPVYIVPKLEYQAKFGVEQVTQSEVARDWISCYVKPNTRLVRGRINALTSELMKIDDMDLNAIVRPSISFMPVCALGSLHNLFLQLTELPVGQYILSHNKGDNSCQLMKNTDNKRGAYDLKFSYMGFGPSMSTVKKDEGGVPWIPIDPTVLLPQHRRQGRVPCTFEPPDYISQTAKKHIKKKKAQKKKQWQGKGNNHKT